MITKRVNAVSPSATLRVSELAKKLRREGNPVIDMSVGEPDFPTPSFIIEAAYKAMKEGKVFYTPTRGIPELLSAISEKLKNENGLDYAPENIITTPGAKYAIYEAIMAVVEEGDEVILLDPSWVTYEACIKMAGGKVVWVPHAEGFEDAPVEDYITSKTKLIIINSPSNPLGVVYPESFLKKIRDLAVDRNILVMSDEVYEKIIFDGKHKSIAEFDGMLERTILINGLSKTYSMTGWRLGYAASTEEIIKAMTKIQSHSVSHPTSFVQYAAVAAIKSDQSFLNEMVSEFKARRDIIMDGLDRLGIKYAPPKGAFYIFMDVKQDSMKFCEEFLAKEYVATTPGSAFGLKYSTWVRVSYATSRENIEEMLVRLERFLS
ncbi:Aspartate/tyrosine/aromatic aminotransferase [Archaeoglobus sulfaticallidus PM70-1]|uniref:Aminotransferase n=1 Tax=Archaeoglobus sulfaticallidus PM70-1 TaxID=387631 RepID=N0BJ29_9EURY|nr:pyridoxal phosphate-dependent aminotransferase [Archaeoglobus sulfaticallidus]AGK60170.1 Aspartate/tyrosine/aromatic aminotransferase [Archaeoglobus sulfaticallidus PM70-1]